MRSSAARAASARPGPTRPWRITSTSVDASCQATEPRWRCHAVYEAAAATAATTSHPTRRRRADAAGAAGSGGSASAASTAHCAAIAARCSGNCSNAIAAIAASSGSRAGSGAGAVRPRHAAQPIPAAASARPSKPGLGRVLQHVVVGLTERGLEPQHMGAPGEHGLVLVGEGVALEQTEADAEARAGRRSCPSAAAYAAPRPLPIDVQPPCLNSCTAMRTRGAIGPTIAAAIATTIATALAAARNRRGTYLQSSTAPPQASAIAAESVRVPTTTASISAAAAAGAQRRRRRVSASVAATSSGGTR